MSTPRNWVTVASADHVQRGREGGFMQACHGKVAPLRRVRPGDRVVCYSPTRVFGESDRCQSFTAIGLARDRDPYQVEMAPGFVPYRRDVQWLPARAQPIAPLVERLNFCLGQRSWGFQFRFGFFEIDAHDMQLIAQAMAVEWPLAA